MSGKYVDRNRNAILISVFVFGTTLLAQGQKKSTIQTAFPMTFYGFIKLDAAYDAGRINVGNYARWVENDEERDDQFHLTVRQTRGREPRHDQAVETLVVDAPNLLGDLVPAVPVSHQGHTWAAAVGQVAH